MTEHEYRIFYVFSLNPMSPSVHSAIPSIAGKQLAVKLFVGKPPVGQLRSFSISSHYSISILLLMEVSYDRFASATMRSISSKKLGRPLLKPRASQIGTRANILDLT
jgi:hypothetical protein